MRDFFKPWRRKIGVVTLVLALLLTGGWVRSHTIEDRLAIKDVRFVAQSTLGGIGCYWDYHNEIADDPMIEWLCCPIRDLPSIYCVPGPVPYWSIVLPLALLSAWLLLSRPRTAKKPESAAPAGA